MMSIPDFFDNYHLPDGVHECTIEEIEQRFLFSSKRIEQWKLFKQMLNRLIGLGLKPSAILIDGSFVTGRLEPGDVDFAALIPPETVLEAMRTIDDHDKAGIQLFMNPENQLALRNLFGAHLLLADNEYTLDLWADFFRTGGQNGKLRERDEERDPEWVIVPSAKGILKVYLDGGEV
ncbi:hypothetical protein C161_26940 [Paenibacillus sp. FSL R5-192]|uniref:DUF6932 family protein n=1 Tax=Paenibacillus sp. FSL R5-192 TaxID=1226754 RepID=UPI0003E1F03F|nr:hypothetical protein [Paenibacillus sp. FSL R5-192]ETT31671.1 hypothetical protein C161_26940 [Paenibacillus sp. FSL R5-192]